MSSSAQVLFYVIMFCVFWSEAPQIQRLLP